MEGGMEGWIDERNKSRQPSLSHLPDRVARKIKLNDVKVFQNHKALYKYILSYISPKLKLKVIILWEKIQFQ